MDFVPDVSEALRIVRYQMFSKYSRAYISTNESLRTSMKLMPNGCERALTVAASGDHPMFCSLYGAKYVDTFDISYNAKCLMDIKTTAIHCLSRSKYFALLDKLLLSENIQKVSNMKKILEKLPAVESGYLYSMNGCFVFNHTDGRGVHGVMGDSFQPNDKEYARLKKIVPESYDFIWSGLDELSGKLTQTYDFMHLSNIFDYIRDPDCQAKILSDLLQHVNFGGRIVIQHLCVEPWDCAPAPMNVRSSKHEAKNWKFSKINGDISMFERIR